MNNQPFSLVTKNNLDLIFQQELIYFSYNKN